MDYIVPTYSGIPQTQDVEIKQGYNTFRIPVPEQPYYQTMSELIRQDNYEREVANPLRLMLAAKLPDQLTRHLTMVCRRVIDLETSRDVVSVRFCNKEGVPVELRTPFAGYPSDALVGQLTLLLS